MFSYIRVRSVGYYNMAFLYFIWLRKYYNDILLGVLANIITCMVGWTHFVDGVKGHPFCLLEVLANIIICLVVYLYVV